MRFFPLIINVMSAKCMRASVFYDMYLHNFSFICVLINNNDIIYFIVVKEKKTVLFDIMF